MCYENECLQYANLLCGCCTACRRGQLGRKGPAAAASPGWLAAGSPPFGRLSSPYTLHPATILKFQECNVCYENECLQYANLLCGCCTACRRGQLGRKGPAAAASPGWLAAGSPPFGRLSSPYTLHPATTLNFFQECNVCYGNERLQYADLKDKAQGNTAVTAITTRTTMMQLTCKCNK